MRTLEQQFNESNLIPIFEIEVKNKETQEIEYIIFDISIKDNYFFAEHVALTTEEANSEKIAHVKIEIDSFFSLDENLQELYDECINKVLYSDFYEFHE